MNSSTNLTFTIPHKEGLPAAAEIDILMTFVFIGVAAGVMAILLAGFMNVKRKEASEMKTVRILFKMSSFLVEFEAFLISVLFKK